MPVETIVKVPNKVLTTVCEKVKLDDPQLKDLIKDLKDTLNNAQNPQGAGLARSEERRVGKECRL